MEAVAKPRRQKGLRIEARKGPGPYCERFKVIYTTDGKSHRIVNAELPAIEFNPDHAVCVVCGHAYTLLVTAYPPTVCCEECRGEQWAKRCIAFQVDSGVRLGWRIPEWMSSREMRGMDRNSLPFGMSIQSGRNRLSFCESCGGDMRRGRCGDCGISKS